MDITEAISDYLDKNEAQRMTAAGEKLLDRYEDEIWHDEHNGYYFVHIPVRTRHVIVIASELRHNLILSCDKHSRSNSANPCECMIAALLYLDLELIIDEEDSDGEEEDGDEWHTPSTISSDPEAWTGPELPGHPAEWATLHMSTLDFYYLHSMRADLGANLAVIQVSRIVPLHTDSPEQQFLFKDKFKKTYTIDIVYDRHSTYKTRCTCGVVGGICIHVVTAFQFAADESGWECFTRFRDYSKEKNKILSRYGLTIDDPDAELFEWKTDPYDGELTLSGVPSSLVPLGDSYIYDLIRQLARGRGNGQANIQREPIPDYEVVDFEVGILFSFQLQRPLSFEIVPAFVRNKRGKQDFKKMSLQDPSNWKYMQALPDHVYESVVGFNEELLSLWLKSAHHKTFNPYSYQSWNTLNQPELDLLLKRAHSLLDSMWAFLLEWPFVYRLKENRFSNKNIEPIRLAEKRLQFSFYVKEDPKMITVGYCIWADGRDLSKIGGIVLWAGLLYEIEGLFYLPANADDLPIINRFPGGNLKFPRASLRHVFTHVVVPLRERFPVEMEDIGVGVIDGEPHPRVMFEEMDEKYLVLRPQFMYDNVLVSYNSDSEYITEHDGQTLIVIRNRSIEDRFYNQLRKLHEKFSSQRNKLYYLLSFNEVMTDNWFVNIAQQLQHEGIPVYGLQQLKRFRYNTSRPRFDVLSTSGTDWFDLKISISWGDQLVSLKDIRKAIINRQDSVMLGDGTLGVIPQEWLKQYAPLMKFGTEKDGSLRLNKLHFMLLEDIDALADSDEARKELAARKDRLLQADKFAPHEPSPKVLAELRPYQVSGFKWLQSLDAFGWGGCLADDMGLGKTLQVITFLQYLKEKEPGGTHLVICPTSLIYNWSAEINKFCPTMRAYIYYGGERAFGDEHFEDFDVVITSYGIVRNDLEHLMRFQWLYLVLDESHVIKNPDALTTRAVMKLRSRNKIILSGTPVQNNTYDLYAQMTFLNPGFLGTREFFKTEYVTAIERQSDPEKMAQLKRMIHPFLLRRTKEQVTDELPVKTEVILWCSLEPEQRKVYDAYRNHYRDLLLKKIEEEGLNKAGIYVLEGLLRLRQICDHPALLKDKEITTEASVKVNSLVREISEHTSNHKLLVFSQFTEMLSIVASELDRQGISYCYLDGSTPAEKRSEQVALYQRDESIRIFLLSLKAGGVGLNLTAADYIYLIDPWWNPAVEQQAIDRAHRIGQEKKVFAYKMICKDTVEEKILELQQKKRALASELVSEEKGFVKNLTREDVEFLFS